MANVNDKMTKGMVNALQHRSDAIKLRNYGRIIQDLVAYVTTIADRSQREAATIFVARCMRQKNQIWNKDFESGIERLREDIDTLSGGKLSTDFPEFVTALTRSAAEVSTVRQAGKGQVAKRARNVKK